METIGYGDRSIFGNPIECCTSVTQPDPDGTGPAGWHGRPTVCHWRTRQCDVWRLGGSGDGFRWLGFGRQ